jgi:ketosteroid isomerase-like protein
MFSDSVGRVNSRDGSVRMFPKSNWNDDFVRDFGETIGTHQDFTVNSTKALSGGKTEIATTFTGYDFDRKTNAKVQPATGALDFVIGKEGGQWKIQQEKWATGISAMAKEMGELVKKFQDADNREDLAILKTMLTKDVVRVAPDGTTQKGLDEVAAAFSKDFDASDVNIYITLSNGIPQFDGSMIVTGAFYQNGRMTNGTPIHFDGAYANKVVKENGQWKISEMKLSPLVKTVAHHKVADYEAWKKGFDTFGNERRFAGELSAEVSTSQDDPNTVCVIQEWASPEAAKAFFARADLAATMKKIGVQGKPTIMVLSKK